MHQLFNRELTIKKSDLITRIKANKEEHVKDYETAIIAYRAEAKRQLENAMKELEDGSLSIKLHLITPVNRADEYDKVAEMFEWETRDEIKITQNEFNNYVHDDNDASRQAKLLNSSYVPRH
jgi:hypothetical protein